MSLCTLAIALAVWGLACGPDAEENRAQSASLRVGSNVAALQSEITRRPNILLVTIDTLRADHCSSYGYPRPTTPHLDALASAGTLFETAYTPMPTTLPAHAALFTSRTTRELGVNKNGIPLPEDATTLAEILRDEGYDTAAFVSSFVLDEQFGIDQGFELYDDDFSEASGNLRDDYQWHGKEMDQPFDRHAAATVTQALEWLQSRKQSAPFFLWVHFFDPHQPLRPREPYRSQFARADVETEPERVVDRYDAEVRYTDEQLGRLLEAVETLAPAGETLTVLAADHGEGLWQHGWLEHGVNLYDEATRVPFVWRWPGRISAGQRISTPVSLIDLLPTLVGLLDLPARDAAARGHDLSAVVTGKAPGDGERHVFMNRRHYDRQTLGRRRVSGPAQAVRWGQWKLIDSKNERGIELYDLAIDPGENHDVAGWRPHITDSIKTELSAWRASQQKRNTPPPALSEEARKGLEALGYIE